MKQQIISVSRRTDIPAFYAQWFINRLREGYCYYPNPMYPSKFHRVDLSEKSLAGIVFWTRWPKPLMRYLDEIDSLDVPYYFQFTINGYPKGIDPHSPSIEQATDCFIELSERLGANRVIWRYDPILLTSEMSSEWYAANFENILMRIGKSTKRIVLSIVDPYKKTTRRLSDGLKEDVDFSPSVYAPFLNKIVKMAHDANVPEIMSCAEPDVNISGLQRGRCIDGCLLEKLLEKRRDSDAKSFCLSNEIKESKKISKAVHGQRDGCLCHKSVDIGVNNTCGFGCAYCYATINHAQAQEHAKKHNPEWNCMSGQVE